MRRTVGITQQNTLDDSKLKCRRLSTNSELSKEVRRSSISIIPPKLSDVNINTSSNKSKLSSFQENTGSCTVLTTQPQQPPQQPPQPLMTSSNNNSSSDLIKTDNLNLNTGAIIISVSSVVDEENTAEEGANGPKEIREKESEGSEKQDPCHEQEKGEETVDDEKTKSDEDKRISEAKTKSFDGDDNKKVLQVAKLEIAMAPLAVPDSESPCSECNPDLPDTQVEVIHEAKITDEQQQNTSEDKQTKEVKSKKDETEENATTDDSKQKEICPWEDE